MLELVVCHAHGDGIGYAGGAAIDRAAEIRELSGGRINLKVLDVYLRGATSLKLETIDVRRHIRLHVLNDILFIRHPAMGCSIASTLAREFRHGMPDPANLRHKYELSLIHISSPRD